MTLRPLALTIGYAQVVSVVPQAVLSSVHAIILPNSTLEAVHGVEHTRVVPGYSTPLSSTGRFRSGDFI